MTKKIISLMILTLLFVSLIPNVIADEIIDGELDVWPGDTNNDGIVNDEDKTLITEFFGVTGTPRSDAGDISWKAHIAKPWENILATFADANGDGKVDQADNNVIGVNYGKKVSSIENQPPIISGVSGPQNLKVYETGTWTVKAYDSDGNYLSYKVDWGDYTVMASSSKTQVSSTTSPQQATFTHSYSSAGNYKVTFTVTDEKGASVVSSVTVTVGTPTNSPPKIDGIAIPDDVQPGEKVTFIYHAIDSDGDGLSWSVSWGDGTGETGTCPVEKGKNQEFKPSHVWNTAGVYSIQTSVNDCKGGSDTSSGSITVGTPTNPIRAIKIPSTFHLNKGETGQVTNYQGIIITLDDVYGNPECKPTPGTFCAQGFAREYALITIFTSGGCGPNADPRCLGPPGSSKQYKIFVGESLSVSGITLNLLNAKTSSADFSIVLGSALGKDEIPVYLNQKFDLYKSQTAVVTDYNNMKVRLNNIAEICGPESQHSSPPSGYASQVSINIDTITGNVVNDESDSEIIEGELDVWSGDANNDGIVNDEDKSAINEYFGYSGYARDDAGDTSWKAHPAKIWEEIMATFADANGDGKVDEADVLVVGLNYGKGYSDMTTTTVPTTTTTLSTCPELTPPSPDFCKDGIIVPGRIDVNGCQMPPSCAREGGGGSSCQLYAYLMIGYSVAQQKQKEEDISEEIGEILAIEDTDDEILDAESMISSEVGGSGGGVAVSSVSTGMPIPLPNLNYQNDILRQGESTYFNGVAIKLIEITHAKASLIIQTVQVANQNEIAQKTQMQKQTSINQCNGCITDSKCVPYGTRITEDNKANFCDVTKNLIEQKEKGTQCQNNYECKTNQCNDGVCSSLQEELRETRGLLQKIIAWLTNIFGSPPKK